MTPNIENKCAECSEIVKKNEDSLVCYGFCNRKFHFSCIAKQNEHYKKAVLNYLNQIANFQWFCVDCIPFTINGTLNGVLKKINSCADNLISINHGVYSPLTPMHTEHSGNASANSNTNSNLDSNEAAHSSNIATTTTMYNQTTLTQADNDMRTDDYSADAVENTVLSVSMEDLSGDNNDACTQQQQINRKRKINSDDVDEQPKRTKLEIPTTSSNISLNELVYRKNAINTNDKQVTKLDFAKSTCIYLSPFIPSTSIENIMDHLRVKASTRIIINKIKCTKLVNDKKKKKLSFVSFKLVIPSEFKNRLMNASIWPIGVTAKEFIDIDKKQKNSKHMKISMRNTAKPPHVAPKNSRAWPLPQKNPQKFPQKRIKNRPINPSQMKSMAPIMQMTYPRPPIFNPMMYPLQQQLPMPLLTHMGPLI